MKQQTKDESQYYPSSYRTLLLVGVIIITFLLISQFLNIFTLLIQKVQRSFTSLRSSSSSQPGNYNEFNESQSNQDKYHDTLVVDLDIRSNPKIAKAEEIWERSRKGNLQNSAEIYQWKNLISLFSPTFNCPYFTERLADGKWICGLELFENHPECVIYSFRRTIADVDETFRTEILTRTNYCRIFIYSREIPKTQSNPRVQFHNISLSAADEERSQKKILRTLLRQNGHGWIDFLNIEFKNSEEFPVLKQIMEDFEVLPWGQLQITQSAVTGGNVEDTQAMFRKFRELFAKLETRGLRPFHAQVTHSACDVSRNLSQVTLEYSFINVRGKHLLINSGIIH